VTDARRRLLAEFLGTGMLVAVVVGSGIAAQTLSTDIGLELLENSLATVAGLAVLILIFGPISGAHFNPIVSIAEWVLGRRGGTGLAPAEVAAYGAAQTAGAIGGSILANAMFAKPLVSWSQHHRGAPHLWLGEVVATAGLLLVIVSLARNGKSAQTPWAVGAYIGAAYFFTSSTSFANPAVAVGRAFTNTFAGIAPVSLPGFVIAELVGGGAGLALLALLYPTAGDVADDLLVPHDADPNTARKPSMSRIPEVLFVCVHNAGRSQMAAALLDHHAQGRVTVRSAGSIPANEINPAVLTVMNEIGLDLSTQFPKPLTTDAIQASDVVITMGCGDACPIFPGKTYLDWRLDDPAGLGVDQVRPIRDEINRRVQALLTELAPVSP
jgi:arsenate reductase